MISTDARTHALGARRRFGGYFPECNPLVPLWHHALGSKVPAAKCVPIRLSKVDLDTRR